MKCRSTSRSKGVHDGTRIGGLAIDRYVNPLAHCAASNVVRGQSVVDVGQLCSAESRRS
jgi:hypothetical protein